MDGVAGGERSRPPDGLSGCVKSSVKRIVKGDVNESVMRRGESCRPIPSDTVSHAVLHAVLHVVFHDFLHAGRFTMPDVNAVEAIREVECDREHVGKRFTAHGVWTDMSHPARSLHPTRHGIVLATSVC